MKASTEKVVEALGKLKIFLENALEAELEETTKEYTNGPDSQDLYLDQALGREYESIRSGRGKGGSDLQDHKTNRLWYLHPDLDGQSSGEW